MYIITPANSLQANNLACNAFLLFHRCVFSFFVVGPTEEITYFSDLVQKSEVITGML